MERLLAAIESTGLARSVGESLSITAWLSAAHLIGFTLVMAGAVTWNLRAAGLVAGRLPPAPLVQPALRLIVGGLAISLLTGFALFSPRAYAAASSGAFQLKMGLLVVAAAFQLIVLARAREWARQHQRASEPGRGAGAPAPWLRLCGAAGLVLWLALAGTACWFILFE